jgi:hypothetical protein
MKQLRPKYQKPVDYLVNRSEPVTTAFVGQFLAVHETGDPGALDTLTDIAAAAYMSAKRCWHEMSEQERISTNAMLYLYEGLSKGDTVEPQPQTTESAQ